MTKQAPTPLIRVHLEARETSSGRRLYYLRATHSVGGQRRRRTFPTGTTHKRVAEQKRRELEQRVAAGFDPFADAPVVLRLGDAVERFVEDCAARGLRMDSVDTYREVLGQFMRHVGAQKPLDAVTVNLVRSFCVQDHLAPASREHRLRHLKVFLGWAVDAGVIDENPASQAKLPRANRSAPKVITPREFERILIALDHRLDEAGDEATQRAEYWLKPAVQTAWYLGLRRGEVLRLRWRDVDFDSRTVVIRRSKGGDRMLPLPSVLAGVLREWHEVTGPDGFVFTTSRGLPPDGDYLGRRFRRTCKLAGVSTGSFHALRHGHASSLLAGGASTREVQVLLGHASVRTTEGYLHVVTDRLRDLLDGTFSRE